MFGGNTATLIKVVVVTGLAALGGGYAWGRLDGAAMTQGAVARALSEARQSTENAINELADEADRARVRRYANACRRRDSQATPTAARHLR